ncbi:hypothetical protein GPALN_014519 [Globodera pallida]|nr:hypothetical protein GPALN_014519 [Globodera pallida]
MDNEFVPDENDGDPSDDQPYTDEHVELDDIRSMFRFIKLILFEPNFSNRYLINLGSLEPQGLWLNRRIFMNEGNYHAFLYANVDKNRRNQNYSEEVKQQFLGHAPLTKINEENGGSNSQQTELSEYRLSIPIDLTRLFKHKIWEIELRIYHQYEESKYSLDSLIASRGKKPLIEGQIVIKMHAEIGGNFVHMFHKDCINECDFGFGNSELNHFLFMFDRRAQLHCPLCNVTLNVEMTVKLPPKFESAADSFSNLYINSMRQLFQIANGHENANNFKQRQAKKTIQYILSWQKKREEKLKKLLREMEFQNIVPFLDEEFIEIRELNDLVNNRQNSHEKIEKAKIALKMIGDMQKVQVYAAYGLENMKNVSEKEVKSKFKQLKSHLKISDKS